MADQFQQDLGQSLSSGQVPTLDDLRKQLDMAFGPDAKPSKRTSEQGGFLNSPVFDILGSILTKDPTFALKKQKFMAEMDRIKGQEENAKFDRLKTYIQAREYLENQKPISEFTTPSQQQYVNQPGSTPYSPEGGYETPTTPVETQTKPPTLDLTKLGKARVADIPKFSQLAEFFKKEGPTRVAVPEKSRLMEFPPGGGAGKEILPAITEPGKNKTPEMLIEGALKERLGRQPTDTEIKSQIQKEAKGYETPQEAFAVAQQMVKAAGPDSGLVPSYELTKDNKYAPKPLPNITLRIPPNMPTTTPGISYDKRKDEWHEKMPDGSTRKLSSAEVEQRNLEFKELAPTETTKTMQQMAPKVIDLAKKLKSNIQEQSANMGPGASRWRDFWSGKVGSEDPEFRKIAVGSDLLSTLLARMHVGARGGRDVIENFKNMMGAGHQSPENMIAALDYITDYANETKKSTIRPSSTITQEETKTINGKDYIKKNGKWFEK